MNKKIVFCLCVLCSACATDPGIIKSGKDHAPKTIPIDVLAVPDAVPRYEKRTRAGNPVKYKVLGKSYRVLADSRGYSKRGMASWYGAKFHGKKTSNGEVYNMYAMTAAHRTLPIPSYVRVKHLKNGRSVVVRINDRGPFHGNRIIDLSYTAAVKLGIQKTGTGFVEVTALEPEKITKNNEKKSPLSAGSVMYLQIGAFASLFNAEQCQEKLLSGEITKSRIQVAQRSGDQLYKVQVGPIDSIVQADEVNQKLDYLGYRDMQLVVEKR